MKKFLIILSGLIFCLCAQTALAVGVGVKPKKINLNLDVNTRAKVKVLVMNVSREPAMYTVYPDTMPDLIGVEPANFRLEAGGIQIVELAIDKKTPGKIVTNLSVAARPLGGGFQMGSGIKIPIVVQVVGFPTLWAMALVGCLTAGLAVANIRKINQLRS